VGAVGPWKLAENFTGSRAAEPRFGATIMMSIPSTSATTISILLLTSTAGARKTCTYMSNHVSGSTLDTHYPIPIFFDFQRARVLFPLWDIKQQQQ
jgi:hypothetical protein